jgi:hypothetical protein
VRKLAPAWVVFSELACHHVPVWRINMEAFMPEWVHTISGWVIVHKEHITLLAAAVSAVMAVVVACLTVALAKDNRRLRKAGTEPEVVAYLLISDI